MERLKEIENKIGDAYLANDLDTVTAFKMTEIIKEKQEEMQDKIDFLYSHFAWGEIAEHLFDMAKVHQLEDATLGEVEELAEYWDYYKNN